MADKRADDSSDEDEQITVTIGGDSTSRTVATGGATAGDISAKRDDLSSAWMDAEEEDEEDEDAEWSQLGAAMDASTSTPAAAPATKAASSSSSSSSLSADQEAKRSPQFKRLWTSVDANPWNIDAWVALMSEVQTLPIDEARVYYERFLTLYPTSGKWWKLYAEHELREKHYDRVQEIIKKSLMQLRCPHVELWLFYLNFTKVVQVDVAVATSDPGAIRTARQLMCDAFELALERVGGSIHAAPVWQAYVGFLQDDASAAADPQAFLSVRKVFHRAVTVPLHNMDAIWREYEKFERAIPNNEALAANFFKVFRQKFDAARAVLRDRKKLFDAVSLHVLCVPVNPRNMRSERGRMDDWQKIVAFETGNPERLDSSRWKARMRFTFELLLSVFRHAPEAWYHYAAFEKDAQEPDAATQVFERALEALPSSSLLAFALADHHELRGDVVSARAVYERQLKDHVSALAYVTYMRFARRALGAKGLNEARTIFRRARKDDREGACSYHVFAAAALLEFYSDSSGTGREIALKIFELGLKKFIQDPQYVLCYLDFLGHLNDDNNMRSLFEKVLAIMSPDLTRPIWDRYVEFEHKMVANGGDLATISKVEARRALAFPDAPHVQVKGLVAVMHRYSFLDLRPPAALDQMFMDEYGVATCGADEQNQLQLQNGFPQDSGGFNDGGPAGFFQAMEMERTIPGPPLPDFLKEFAMLLPLHQPWNGPIADVEHIFRAMLLVDFPPRAQIEFMEQQKKQHLMAQQMQQQQQQQQQQQSEMKRGHDDNDGEGGGGVGVSHKRPANDIFRARQKLKLAKN